MLQELAELLAEEEQFEEAIKQYQQLIKLAKNDLFQRMTARVEIGQIQVRQGKLKTAITTFESCLKEVKPDSWIAVDLRRRIEEMFLRGEDLAGLVQYYEKRLKQQPEDLESMTRLAAALAKLGRDDDAQKQYLAVLMLAPSRDDIRVKLIEELTRREDYSGAIHQTEILVKQQPTDGDYLARLGRLYLRVPGDDRAAAEAKALAIWDIISQLRPDDPLAAVRVAELCREAADIRSALTESDAIASNKRQAETVLGKAVQKYYEQAVHRAKDAEQYHEYLGEFLYSIGRTDEAMIAWRRIVQPPRDSVDNLKRLTQILAGANQLQEAVTTIRQAIGKEQDRYDLHDLAADLYVKSDDLEFALKHVDEMDQLADSPQLAEQALTRRVELYMSTGRLAEEVKLLLARLADPATKPVARDYWLAGKMAAAERRSSAALAHLEKAIQLAPGDARLLRFKAEVHKQGGDLSGTAEQFRRLAKLEPKSRSAHLRQVVQLDLELGSLEAALKTAEEIVRLRPGNVSDARLLAEVHFRSGDDEQGLETFRRTVRLDPRDTEIRLALAGKLIEHQRLNEAIEHLWRAFELSDDTDGRLSIIGGLSEQYIVTDRMPQLIERLQQLRREQEDPFGATLYLVQAHMRADDYAGARRELNGLLSRRPDDVRVIAQLVTLSERLGDNAQAVQYQEKLVALDKQPRQLEHLARLYSDLGRDAEAEAIWQQLILKTTDEKMLVSAIDRAINRQDFKQAMTLADSKWAESPDDWRFGLRLIQASWHAKERGRAVEVARSILNMVPHGNLKPIQNPNTAKSQAAFSRMNRYPAVFMRISLPMQIRMMLSNTNNQGMGMMGWRPRELLDAQMFSALVLYEAARADNKQEAYLSQLQEKSKTDLNALRQVVWVHLSERKTDELRPLLEQWIAQNPLAAEPRIALFISPFLSAGPGETPNPEKHLETMRTQYQWLVDNRPALARFMTAPYAQILIRLERHDEAAKQMRLAIEQARDRFELTQIGYMATQANDLDLLSVLIAKMESLRGSSGSGSYGYFDRQRLMDSYTQLAAEQKEWDKLINSFDSYMTATHPKLIQLDRRITVSTNTMHAQSHRHIGQQLDSRAKFPGPTAWLDESRLPMLQSVYKTLRSAGEVDRLRGLIDRHLEDAEGIPRQCWQLSSIMLLWLENDREEAISQLEQFAEQFPDNVEVRMLIAHVHAQAGSTEKALATLDGLHLPFGALSKSLEQLRLELAQRNNNDEVGKQAALRLFGMRLRSQEQANLAKVMRRLGLAARSDELIQRAVRTASNKPAELMQLMQQYSTSDPKRAAELARMLIRQARRAKSVRSNNSGYRQSAFSVLKRSGELAGMIKKTEQQLAAAPNSVKLMEDLAELYSADGDEEKSVAMFDRIIKIRPNDVGLRYRLAQSFFKRKQYDKGVQRLGIVWKEKPELVLQQAYQLGRYYSRAKKLDLLAEHIALLKGHPFLTQQGYQVSNLLQNLRHNGNDVEEVIKVYRAGLEVLPKQNRKQMVREFGQLLVEKQRKPDAYLLYKNHLFPSPEKQKTVTGSSGGIHYTNGTLVSMPMELADLAVELKKADELAKEIALVVKDREDWKPLGELLDVMLKRRAKNEEPIAQFGRRYLEDKTFAKSLGEHSQTLREELSKCETEPALRAAIALWSQPAHDHSVGYAGIGGSSDQIRVAAMHIKLKQRDEARAILLKSLDSKPAHNQYRSGGGAAERELQQRLPVADALREHGFHHDAVVVYHSIFQRLPDLKSDNHLRRNQSPAAAQAMQQSVVTLLGEGRDEVMATLFTTLQEKPDELSRFFVVVDPPINNDPYRGSRKAKKAKEVASAKSQLLTGLLLSAQKNGQLETIAQQVEAIVESLSDDVEAAERNRWIALKTLVAMYSETPSTAIEPLQQWLVGIQKKKQLAEEPETWLLALAALEFEPTREAGYLLASKVALQAAINGKSMRQQAAIAAVSTRDGDRADAIIQQILAGRKGDPQTLFQIAQTHYQRKQYAKAVMTLEVVWERAPELLMPQLRQLVDYYVKANKIDALAKAIRSVRDQDLWNQHGYRLSNAFNRLPHGAKDAPHVVELYLAAREMTSQNGNYYSGQFTQYLRKLPKDEKKLAIYHQVVFPTKQRDGELASFARGYVDLAKSLGKVEETETACHEAMKQFSQFQAKGELLLAMLQLREGNEQLMRELAVKYRKSPSFAAELNEEQRTLFREMAKCSDGVAVEVALEAYRKQAAEETGQSTCATQQVAALLVKSGDRGAARRILLDASERPFSVNYESNEEYLLQMKLQRNRSLVSEFAKHGFRRDAIAVHAKTISSDTTSLKPNSYVFSMIRQSEKSARELIGQVVSSHLEETLGELEETVRAEQPELDSFFIVLDKDSSKKTSKSKTSKPDAILPEVLAHAKKTNRLQALRDAVLEARKRQPDQLQLVSLDIMCAATANQTEEVTDDLKQLVSSVEESPKSINDSTWLVARAAMSQEATRELGRSLAEAVAQQAGKTGNRSRQTAAVLALTVSLTQDGQGDKAAELMTRLFGTQKQTPETQLQLAEIMFQQQRGAEAVEILESVWKERPDLLISKYEELAKLYVAAGSTKQLAAALKTVDDEKLRNRYMYDIVNAARHIGQDKKRIDDETELLKAAVDFSHNNNYAVSQLARHYRLRGNNDEARQVFRRGVMPPTGSRSRLPSFVFQFLDETIKQKKVEELRADIQAAVKAFPQWQGCGDILLAMLHFRVADSEDLLISMVEKYRSDADYAKQLDDSDYVLRRELRSCKSPVVLELALELWQAKVEEVRTQNYTDTNDFEAYDSLAQVLVKLGRTDEARVALLAALAEPTSVYGSDYEKYHLSRRREKIATTFQKAGLHLDAVKLWQENLLVEKKIVKRRGLKSRQTAQQRQQRKSLHALMTKELDASLTELENRLSSSPQEIESFFAIAIPPWRDNEVDEIPTHARSTVPHLTQLLPALLQHAAQNNRIDQLQGVLAAAITTDPENEHLTALQTLLKPTSDAENLQALIALSKSTDRNLRLLALVSLAQYPQPAATAAIVAATSDRDSKWLAIDALGNQDTPLAVEQLAKMYATTDTEVHFRVIRALERMKTPEAQNVARFERVAFDDFDGAPTMDWTILKEDPSAVSFDKLPGTITITRRRSGAGKKERLQNVFLIPLPEDCQDFQITACVVGFQPRPRAEEASLFAAIDEDNFVSSVYGASDKGQVRLNTYVEVKGARAGRNSKRLSDSPERFWWRLTKIGKQYAIATSSDGKRFVTHGQVRANQPKSVGLTVNAPSDLPSEEREVSFDSFELSQLVGTAVKPAAKKSTEP